MSQRNDKAYNLGMVYIYILIRTCMHVHIHRIMCINIHMYIEYLYPNKSSKISYKEQIPIRSLKEYVNL